MLRRLTSRLRAASGIALTRAIPTAVGVGLVRVTAFGRQNRQSHGDEVIIVKALTSNGFSVDLPRLAGDTHELMRAVHVGSLLPLPFGIKLTTGQWIDLPLGRGGSLHLVAHPWSGSVSIETAEQQRTVDLFAESTKLVQFEIDGLLPLITPSEERLDVSDPIAAFELSQEIGVRMARLAHQRKALGGLATADVLALYTPRWAGVTAATLNLFPCTLPIPLLPTQHPEDLDALAIETIADAIAASPFKIIVFSGGDTAFFRLFEECRRRRPGLDFRLLWHSSYMQMGEPHDWNLLMPWLGAAQQKRLGRFGVVKPGMDRFLASHGVNAMFVQNAVPFRRPATMPVTERENSVGIWLSGSSDYRKPVLPSLLAVAGISGLRLRAAGLGELGYRVVEELRIPTAAKFARPISHSDVLAQMRQTVATVYVTLSECMPMVPLESIAQGSPCVVGPATELFDDDPGLAALLVVKDPTDPAAIRRALAAVLDDRARLLERCTDYLESLNARASRTLTAFLG